MKPLPKAAKLAKTPLKAATSTAAIAVAQLPLSNPLV